LDVEPLSIERESPSLRGLSLSKDQPIDYKRVVILSSSLDRVDPERTFESLIVAMG
jgi:hypothetical protein